MALKGRFRRPNWRIGQCLVDSWIKAKLTGGILSRVWFTDSFGHLSLSDLCSVKNGNVKV